jgi:hypothetical protein
VENPADGTPPLVAAPRHLRRRRLHREIPDALLVPDAELFPLSLEQPATNEAPTDDEHRVTDESEVDDEHPVTDDPEVDDEHPVTDDPEVDDEEAAYRRKRLAALLAVIFVAVTVPALILVLLLLG